MAKSPDSIVLYENSSQQPIQYDAYSSEPHRYVYLAESPNGPDRDILTITRKEAVRRGTDRGTDHRKIRLTRDHNVLDAEGNTVMKPCALELSASPPKGINETDLIDQMISLVSAVLTAAQATALGTALSGIDTADVVAPMVVEGNFGSAT